MNLKLFQPDIFSKPHPEFIPVLGGIFDNVIALLGTHYSIKPNSIKEIKQVRGNELNSNNFKVETTAGTFNVKKNVLHKDISELTRIFKLANWLHEQGHLFFETIPCNNGNLIVEQDAAFWCVSEFVEGRYFSGGGLDELESVGRRIGELQSILRAVPDILRPQKEIDLFPVDGKRLIDEAFDIRKSWAAIFGKEYAAILEDNWDLMLFSCALINSKREVILRSGAQACHYDLHPHNILINDHNVVTFVDPDSLLIANPDVGIAFSIYKLMKQSMISLASYNDPENKSEYAKDLFLSIREKYPFTKEATCNLYVFALAEIFRRILVILRLSLHEKDKSWNYVLPIHFEGIKESEIIFGASTSL
jgi:hypothetical protein